MLFLTNIFRCLLSNQQDKGEPESSAHLKKMTNLTCSSQVWQHVSALDENKSDLANLLSEYLVNNVFRQPNGIKLVTGAGFSDDSAK